MPGEEQTLLKVSLPPPLAPAWQALWLESGREGWLPGEGGGLTWLQSVCWPQKCSQLPQISCIPSQPQRDASPGTRAGKEQ